MKTVRKIIIAFVCVVIVGILGFVGYNIALKYMYPIKYQSQVETYAREFNVEKSLVFAVIKCESDFNKNAESSAGAKGLMQLTEETFYDVSKILKDGQQDKYTELWNDADTNIKYGTRYLKYLFDMFNGDKTAVLAAYNAGLGNVKQWMGEDQKLQRSEIAFPETKEYVEKVLETQKHYQDK